jgi:hypothetical protein
MGDELSCLTELLCCCILLEDAQYTNNMNNLRNNHNTINNLMERNEGSNDSNDSNESNEQEYYFDNDGNCVKIVRGEPVKFKRN